MPRNKSKCTNKGVTATGSDINESFSSKKEPESQTPSNKLQHELRNVIELMGPSTPHLTANPSSDADNEDSYYTSTSIYSSVLQVKHLTKTDESSLSGCQRQQSSDTPRDISQISALPADTTCDDYHGESCVERPSSINDSDRSPGAVDFCQQQRQQQQQRPHYQTCGCREYVKNYQERISKGGGVVFKSNEYTILQKGQDHTRKGTIEKAMNLFTSFKLKRPSKDNTKEALDLYRINIMQANDNENPAPKRLVFDLVDDIPKPETNTVATNTAKEMPRTQTYLAVHPAPEVPTPFHSYIPPGYPDQMPQRSKLNEKHKNKQETRVDVYYFDHGDSSYFRTTDCPPALHTEVIAEKTEAYTAKFWAEFFGTIHIGFAFVTSFILQFLRFILQSLVRPLTVGLTQLTSDYFFKPCLAVIFNAVIQPPLIFLYNIAMSVRDLADPIAEGIGYFLREIANIFRAIRLVNVNKTARGAPCSLPLRRKRLKTRARGCIK